MKIAFVRIEDLDGDTTRMDGLEGGITTTLGKEFEEYYGEHDSLLFVGKGLGLRKIQDLGNKFKYVCLKAV